MQKHRQRKRKRRKRKSKKWLLKWKKKKRKSRRYRGLRTKKIILIPCRIRGTMTFAPTNNLSHYKETTIPLKKDQ